jgi:hypothetical protein
VCTLPLYLLTYHYRLIEFLVDSELFFRMVSLLLRWSLCVAMRRYIRMECEEFKLCTPALKNVVCLFEIGR